MGEVLGLTAAARAVGKSRVTLHRHIKDGKLSCTVGADGSRGVAVSELMRVYGALVDGAGVGPQSAVAADTARGVHSVASQQDDTVTAVSSAETAAIEAWKTTTEALNAQIEHLKEMLAREQDRNDRLQQQLLTYQPAPKAEKPKRTGAFGWFRGA